MIFQHTWMKVVEGTKTQTRRLVKLGETLEVFDECYTGRGGKPFVWSESNDRMVYEWSKSYAVQPGRGKPALWWRANGLTSEVQIGKPGGGHDQSRLVFTVDEPLPPLAWRQLRIRITNIRRERLQDITDADARAEGCQSAVDYLDLWDEINGKRKGARWEDNPKVWVLTFEVVS